MPNPLLPFPQGTRHAKFVLREKRFRVLTRMDGQDVWVHTNNSGSMLGLLRPGGEVLVSPANNPARKLKWTLEAVLGDGFWICVNTLAPNRLLRAAHGAEVIAEMAGYDSFVPEAVVGESRIDACLSGPAGRLWVEAKNVTLVEEECAYFPDAATVRGQKHLRELSRLVSEGDRAAVFYLIPRADARCFAPASFIDPDYAELFRQAAEAGVEAWPYVAEVTEAGLSLGPRLPVADHVIKPSKDCH